MFSRTIQPTVKSFCQITCYTMWSLQYVGVVKKPCRSKFMAFSNKPLLLSFSWERGFLMGSSVTEWTWTINGTQRVFDDFWRVNVFTDDICDCLCENPPC